jgi:Putative prokaryotic signal transducing protein
MKHCPNCRTEYEDFARECMDCRVALVAGSVQEARESSDIKLVAIRTFLGFTAAADAEMAKNLLEAEGIPFVTTGVVSARLSSVPLDVRLLVREDDVERAVEILESCSDAGPLPDEAS